MECKFGHWLKEFCQGAEVVLLATTVKVGVRISFFIGIIVDHLGLCLIGGLIIDDSWLYGLTLSTTFGPACDGLSFGFFYHSC